MVRDWLVAGVLGRKRGLERDWNGILRWYCTKEYDYFTLVCSGRLDMYNLYSIFVRISSPRGNEKKWKDGAFRLCDQEVREAGMAGCRLVVCDVVLNLTLA